LSEATNSLVYYWLNEFDWRARERYLNGYPQSLAQVGDETVHFAHIRSSDASAIPIILTHGWPYTFAEMLPLADELREFHVVVPSLPGMSIHRQRRERRSRQPRPRPGTRSCDRSATTAI
jgi:pimeloyl-ACP methyl ester carboxylesterase